MPAEPYESVRQSLGNGKLAPVYYVTGDEDILKDDLVAGVIDAAVDPASRDFNVDIRNAGDLTPDSFTALVETPPMLAERRVAIVRGIENWRKGSKVSETLMNYLKQPSPTTSLVLVGGSGYKPDPAIVTKAAHVVCNAPSADALVPWIMERGLQSDIRIDKDAAAHLVRSVAGSLSLAAIEMEKLSVAVDPGTEIGVADLERYVGVRHGETMWDWVDKVLHKDTASSIRLLDIVIPQPGVTGVKLVTALGTALVGTRMTKGLLDGKRTPKQVEEALWSFLKKEKPRGIGRYSEEIKRWLAVAKRWTGPELDEAIELLYKTDQRLKSGSIGDERAVLTNLLLYFRALKEAA